MPRSRKPRRLRFNVYRGTRGQLPTLPPGELLLEYFSDADIVAWYAHGENIQRYHYLWWFELESQRALHQQAMIDALKSGHIGHAGLDVFNTEPLPAGHPLTELPNVTLSAHSAFRTPEASENLIGAAWDHCRRIAKG